MENIQKWVKNDTNLYTGLHIEQALLPRVAPLRFREKKFLIHPRFGDKNGLCGRKCLLAKLGKTTNTAFTTRDKNPAEFGKTTNTTFTTSNNLHAVACITILLQGKQQNTRLRGDN